MEKAKEISDIRCQPNIFLTRARIRMIPDFSAINSKTGEVEYFEAKGFEGERWLICKKLWSIYGPGRLHIFKGRAGKVFEVDSIVPRG